MRIMSSVLAFCLGLPFSIGLGIAGGGANAQPAPSAPPSPATLRDVSRPMFDTVTTSFDAAPDSQAAAAVVAEVEGRPITMGDVGNVIRALPPGLAKLPFETLFPGVVDQLIKQQALVIRALEQGLDADPGVRRDMKAAADERLAEDFMQRTLAKQITEAMLLERYNRDVAGHPGPEEARVRVILTESEKEGIDLIAEINAGADFGAVARRASRDVTAAGGGDLGFLTRDRLAPEVGVLAFWLPVGQTAPYPVRTGAGWFVVKVDDRRNQPTPTFPAVREQLRQSMMREGVEALANTALTDFKIRKYSLTGKEIEADKPEPH